MASKRIKAHAKVFKKAVAHAGLADSDLCVASFERRLARMYRSELFREHNVYPTIDVERVYAVIAMCLELREGGLSDARIMECVNFGYTARRRAFSLLLGLVNLLPNSFAIVRHWNIKDHENRVADGSITYGSFEADDHSIKYRITRCRYVDMFAAWGIRPLCKLFCETDTRSYSMLTRHVEFVRHSDLSDGDSCHDDIFDRGFGGDA